MNGGRALPRKIFVACAATHTGCEPESLPTSPSLTFNSRSTILGEGFWPLHQARILYVLARPCDDHSAVDLPPVLKIHSSHLACKFQVLGLSKRVAASLPLTPSPPPFPKVLSMVRKMALLQVRGPRTPWGCSLFFMSPIAAQPVHITSSLSF